MTTQKIKSFIFSNPEWKEHFIICSRALERERNRKSHHFDYNSKTGKTTCWICGQEWDAKYKDMKKCTGFVHNKSQSIESIIKSEEERFFDLMREKEPILISMKDNITGETLSWLHQTHGIDPDLVEDILGIKLTQTQRDDYTKKYEIHKKTGILGFKPTIINRGFV